ncbi:hypothetical protein VaNZ11_006747, partial [Volvox africanus]
MKLSSVLGLHLSSWGQDTPGPSRPAQWAAVLYECLVTRGSVTSQVLTEDDGPANKHSGHQRTAVREDGHLIAFGDSVANLDEPLHTSHLAGANHNLHTDTQTQRHTCATGPNSSVLKCTTSRSFSVMTLTELWVAAHSLPMNSCPWVATWVTSPLTEACRRWQSVGDRLKEEEGLIGEQREISYREHKLAVNVPSGVVPCGHLPFL